MGTSSSLLMSREQNESPVALPQISDSVQRSVKCLRGPTSIHENISKQNTGKTNNEAHGQSWLVSGTDRHGSHLGTHNSTESHHNQARALQLAPHD